jgi:Squalene-hopene cyclase C-terminal domain/Prenyltransferase and squalene oxidase repeat
MRIDRRSFLWIVAGAAACARRDSGPLEKAGRYLWSRQSEDGGFHSGVYGLLRSGQSLTPFALGALLDVPESRLPRPANGVDRAFEFIRKHTNVDGELGRMDPTIDDYPNYATALAVTAFVKARPGGWEKDIAPMLARLRAQQFAETNGWKRSDAAYGAWGMGGPILRPPEAGHVDVSMTRYVLEALRASGVPASDPSIARALVYLERSQNPDGGFYFSAVNADINKAGEAEGHFLSYGTATADGVLALRAAGIPDSDSRVAKAVQWLRTHHKRDGAPGFDSASREMWSSGLRFYYADVISRAVPGLPLILPDQQADGSFRNPNFLVKEDDPIIATTFAIGTLLRQ